MITVLIFSCNRHHYLKRAIKYWSLSPWAVIISDGSDEPLSYHIPSRITYLHRPDISLQSRLIELAQMASTSYSVLAPDDDFHAFKGIDRSLIFLEKNSDYSMTQGLYTRFHLDMTHKNVFLCPDYQYASKDIFDDASPEKRILRAMTGPTMHYCYAVMRTESLKNVLSVLNGVEETSISTFELSFNLALLAHGKYKTLPVFYAAREYHVQNWSKYRKCEDWIRSPSPEGYEKWRLNIASLYEKITGLSEAESLAVFDNAIVKFLDYKKPNFVSTQPSKRCFRKIRDKIPSRFIKDLIMHIIYKGKILNMIVSHRANLMEFRRDWKRIKKIIFETEFTADL
jgi:glycosyltransferase domain-containing protein